MTKPGQDQRFGIFSNLNTFFRAKAGALIGLYLGISFINQMCNVQIQKNVAGKLNQKIQKIFSEYEQ